MFIQMMLTGVAHAMECTALFVMSIELNHQITAHILLPALVLWVDSQWLPVHPLCQRWVEWGLPFLWQHMQSGTEEKCASTFIHLYLFCYLNGCYGDRSHLADQIAVLQSSMTVHSPPLKDEQLSSTSKEAVCQRGQPKTIPCTCSYTSEAEGISEAPFILVLALFNNRTASWNTIVASSENVL